MDETINKKSVMVGTAKELDESEKKRLSGISFEEKSATITYLRECFYGTAATTGRLQRVYTVIERT